LSPVDEAELAKIITRLDEKNPDVILVDMVNPNSHRQLIGAIVPRGGQWFFYKLMGDADAVAPQKEAFIGFAKSEA
jgi:CHASE2 domain-containing sensor protein